MREEDPKISKGMKKFVVEEVREKKAGYLNPVIVTFQNGELNEKLASGCVANLIAKENGETGVEVKTPYGHVFKDSSYKEKPRPKQYLAIRNSKTNKVKLVEVDRTVLINSALLRSTTAEAPALDYGEEVRALNKTFGGKKIMSQLRVRERLNLSSMPVADEIKKAVEDIIIEDNIQNNTETDSIIDLLPPCHRDAKTLSDVYILSEIVSEKELEALVEEMRKVEENKFNPKHYSPFFQHCYTEVKKLDENLDNRLAGILLMECLVKFLKVPSKKLASKTAECCPFSPTIQEKMKNEFCVKTEASLTRPLTMRDKCLCYIITLCLISCNYQINLKLLSTTTSVHLNRLTRLARVVGAVPLTKDEHLFVLKLPLPQLPKSTRGRIRRK